MIAFVHALTAKKSRRGAIALEYALVLAFVAIAVLAALIGLGTKLTTSISDVGDKTSTASSTTFAAP